MGGTPLGRRLTEAIRRHGPIRVSAFMTQALTDLWHGYYATRDPFGADGDFTTAPEISQTFGELIGLWAAAVWRSMGSPPRVVLAELGPGRGTLMADLLRATRVVPPFQTALEPWLVEVSPTLRERQRKTLEGQPARWAESFDDLPPGPLLLVANEFFDALPVDQFIRQGEAWRERRIGLDATGALTFVAGPAAEPPLAPTTDAGEGDIAETCPEGRALARRIGERLATQGGAALIVDYGYARSAPGDTLQAVRRHACHPVLKDVGEADVTAHVDFEALAAAAIPARAWGPVTQGDFLRALGIETRTAMLARGKSPDDAADLVGRMHRLIDAAEMGTLFKVMALAHPALPPPPGLDPR